MCGLAQALYLQRQGRPLVHHFPKNSRWPFLQKMVDQQQLHYIDYALAERLLLSYPHATEEGAAAICFLSLTSRLGHLCVQIKAENIVPDPQLILEEMQDDNFSALPDEIVQLSKMVHTGLLQIPSGLITDISDRSEQISTPLCRWGNILYFQRHWQEENQFIYHYQRLLKQSPKLVLDPHQLLSHLQERIEKKILLPEQAEAIQKSLEKSLSIICGGPGTGKTYTAGVCIQVLWEAMTPEQKERYEIVLAAPTGKAAATLQASLNRVMDSIRGMKPLTAKTLHSLLGVSFDRKNNRDDLPLSSDCIIVDECSMIDVTMMSNLLSKVKNGARLILLGDGHQLPPVETGGLFSDMVQKGIKHDHNVVELNVCMRTESKEIVEFAQAIHKGHTDQALGLLKGNHDHLRRIQFSYPDSDITAIQNAILKHAMEAYPQLQIEDLSSRSASKLLRKFCFLSPMRNGPFGVEVLNRLLAHKMLLRQRHNEFFIAPILIKQNHRQLELFNGDIGFLVRKLPQFTKKGPELEGRLKEGDYALFPQMDSDEFRRIPGVLLPPYEYAYGLSVHKSQGSEFERVLLLMPPGSEIFGRSVLYTAATRARKQLEVWGQDDILRETIQRNTSRVSGFGSG